MHIPPNSLINEDCLNVFPYIKDDSVQLILCDLPYGTTDLEFDKFLIPFPELWQHYNRILTKNGTIILTGSQPFTTDIINSQRNLFKYDFIWVKNRPTFFQHAKNRPLKIHEDCIVFSKGSMMHESLNKHGNRMIYNPQGTTKIQPRTFDGKRNFGNIIGKRPSHSEKVVQDTTDYPENVIYFDRDSDSWHPTQKPVALFSYFINTFTNENDIVLDNCGGSFTTAIDCQNTKRKYIVIEKDKKWFDRGSYRVLQNVPAFDAIQPIVINDFLTYLMDNG